MQTSRNLSIDTLRLIASFEVIALHLNYEPLPSLVAAAIRLQARWAVPFFFIVGGYFLASRLSESQRTDVRPSIYRLIWIFVIWSLIFIPLVLYQSGAREVFRRLLFPSAVYIGEYFHLWFPSSMIFGYVILLFIFHYRLEKWLPVLSIGILIHIFLAGSYNQAFNIKFPFDFVIARHWVSIPSLALGVWLYRRGPLNRWLALGLLVGGLGLQFVEAWILQTRFDISAYDHEILLGTLPFALGVASLGLSGIKCLELPMLSRWGKEYSLGIYLAHPLVTFVSIKIIGSLAPSIDHLAPWKILFPFVILMACIGLFAALQSWLPAVFRFLMGDHLKRID